MKRNGEIKLYIWLFCQCVTILLLFGVANLELHRSNNQWCKGYFHATSVLGSMKCQLLQRLYILFLTLPDCSVDYFYSVSGIYIIAG